MHKKKLSSRLVFDGFFSTVGFSFRISFGVCGRFTVAEIISFCLSFVIVCVWVLTGHWLLMDGKCITVLLII